MRAARFTIFSVLAIGVAIGLTVPSLAADCGQLPVQVKPIGNPMWKPVDFHIFTADTVNWQNSLQSVLHPTRHQWCSELGISPGEAHKPPYDKEIEGGMDISNFQDSLVFKVADFNLPNAIYVMWMNVPSPGTTGSSPDFQSGPIIPNTIFPITLTGAAYRDGKFFFDWGHGTVPPLTDQLSCPFQVDGHSHFPYYMWDWEGIPGHFDWQLKMVDTTGNGWLINIKFTVHN